MGDPPQISTSPAGRRRWPPGAKRGAGRGPARRVRRRPCSTRPIRRWPGCSWPGRGAPGCAPGRCRCRCAGRSPGGWPPARPAGNGRSTPASGTGGRPPPPRWRAPPAGVLVRRPGLSEWMTAWGRVFHAGHGRMASAASRARAEIALRPLVGRLAIRYSDAPWWQHDIWSLKLDPRIPRRPHESRGNTAVRWDKLEPAWLREGFKFYLRLQLESGQLTWSSVMPPARDRVPVRGVPGLPRHRPSRAGRRPGPELRAAGPGLPDLPARLEGPGRAGRVSGRRRPGHADRSPAACRRSACSTG